jgi:N6-adenosine-specific RNA methylase IME4
MQEVTFPSSKYNIIYADPPWSYNDKALAGNRGAGCKYETHGINWLCDLPVKTICHDDCALFMWITMPQLPLMQRVMESWGFTYKTVAFTWIKTNRKNGTPFMGMGNWTRANAELCVLGTRGHIKRVSAGVRQVVMSPITSHSEKPSIVRGHIVALMGDLPRVELFARQRAAGWDCWGNEVPDA